MKSFTINLNNGDKRYACFVQKIQGRAEDIYIINFTDSDLIRLLGSTKTSFSIRKSGQRIFSDTVNANDNFWLKRHILKAMGL